MKKQRGTPRRRRPSMEQLRAKRAKQGARRRRTISTALARRPKVEVLSAPGPRLPQALTPTPMLGELGLVELKLTPEEEAVLSEPVDPERVMIKPTKQATPYLSHPEYTRWFNRAFGRLGWSIVPCSTAAQVGKSIQCSYLLYVHGKPVGFAVGEQEYHESNLEQTYGDALEATVASALRRLAKRMGVGLELWDRDWLNTWIEKHAVCVYVKKGSESVRAWRRRKDPPFWNETGATKAAGSSSSPAAADRSAGYNAKDNEPITDPQRKRLWVIARKQGRTDAEVEVWLAAAYKVKSSREIKRKDYDAIVTAIEKQGPLAPPPDDADQREPGEEG